MQKNTLLDILKFYINGDEQSLCPSFDGWSNEDWVSLMKLSTKQGVSAIVYNTISDKINNSQISRGVKLNWALQSEQIEQRTRQQRETAEDVASIWDKKGIKSVVLKGIGLSPYYPTPWLRECGDFDCYLFNDYDKGIDIVLSEGGAFLHKDYKHAQLRFKKLAIEVHKHFTSYRGEQAKHQLENDLHKLVKIETCKPIVNGSKILSATPTFNACFLLYHTLFHFLFESVTLRHILDWILYIKAEQKNIDWDYVVSFCKRYKLIHFAEALNAIALHHFGIELNTPIANQSIYRDRIMCDILNDNEGVSNKSGWSRRIQLLKNTIKTRWKYELIESTFTKETLKRVFYFIFSKDELME